MNERERQQEILDYRKKFAHVITTDPKSLAQWFQGTGKYLNIGALAAIAQVNRNQIRKWRKLAGIQGPKGQYNPRKAKPINIHTIINPPLPGHRWSEREWLADAYERVHSTTAISKVAGVSHKRVEQRLKVLGLYKPAPIHPCNNEDWLKRNYVLAANSAKECARMAGVGHNTMLEWLAKHGLANHDNEQIHFCMLRNRACRTPLWFKVLAAKLAEQTDVVRYVSLQELGMIVRYETGILEMYFAIPYYKKRKRGGRTFSITVAADARFDQQIQIHRQYPVSFGEEDYNHLMINRSDWAEASLLERRLALHRFQLKQRELGWHGFQYPDSEIDRCLQQFRELSPDNYIKDNIFILHGKDRCTASNCWPIVFSYFSLRPELDWFFDKPRRFLRVLNEMTKHNCAFNTESLLRFACCQYGLKLTSPVGYRAILERLGLRQGGTLLDLQPGVGCKAVACSLIGAAYRTRPHNRRFDNASVYHDFDRRLGLDWDWYRGERVDMVLADNDFRMVNVEYALDTYRSVAKRIVCYVQADKREEYEQKFKPKAVLGVRVNQHRKEVSYLFVW